MDFTIESVDYAPAELYEQCPLVVELVREIPGPDRPDYWLGTAKIPIRWSNENIESKITHLVLAARWEGTRIEPGAKDLPVGIAYVTDETLLNESKLSFDKCRYVAIGFGHDSAVGSKSETNKILAGTIGKLFGRGHQN